MSYKPLVPLPSKVLTGYWMCGPWKFVGSITKYNVLCMMSAAPNMDGPPGSVCFDYNSMLYNTDEDLKQDIQVCRSRGQIVLLTLAAVGCFMDLENEEQIEEFAKSVVSFINKFDLDDTHTEAAVWNRAFRKVAELLGRPFHLFIAPWAGRCGSFQYDTRQIEDTLRLLALQKDMITVCNVQVYNVQGPITSADGLQVQGNTPEFVAAVIENFILKSILDVTQIGIGMSCDSGVSDSASPELIVQAWKCLVTGQELNGFRPRRKYHELAGIMCWNIEQETGLGGLHCKAFSKVLTEVSLEMQVYETINLARTNPITFSSLLKSAGYGAASILAKKSVMVKALVPISGMEQIAKGAILMPDREFNNRLDQYCASQTYAVEERVVYTKGKAIDFVAQMFEDEHLFTLLFHSGYNCMGVSCSDKECVLMFAASFVPRT